MANELGGNGAARKPFSQVADVAAALARCPLPAGQQLQDYVIAARRFALDTSPSALWCVIADTSRLNQALGMPAMTFREEDGKKIGSCKHFGVPHQWEEAPWSWVEGQWMICPRYYRQGLPKSVIATHIVDETPRGTTLTLLLAIAPKNALGVMLAKIAMRDTFRKYARVLPTLVASATPAVPQLERRFATPAKFAQPRLAGNGAARLAAATEQLEALHLQAGVVTALMNHVKTAADDHVARLALPALAKDLAVDERELLRVALHSTRMGILEMTWDAICPHCRGPKQRVTELAKLQTDQVCEPCAKQFDLLTPQSVEVSFAPHPSIRPTAQRMYCSAEANAKQHIKVHLVLQPGEQRQLRPQLAEGEYVFRAVGHPAQARISVTRALAPAAAPAQTLTVTSSDPHTVTPDSDLIIVNPTANAIRVVIESAAWRKHALPPDRLLTVPEFRDLFSDQYLGSDVKLGVGEQTILFTDVVGSTQFYRRHGDPDAFVQINKHFETAFAIVAEYRGAVIKTIGDAVMAAFSDPVDAIAAGAALHQAFGPTTNSPLRLRISLHTGPCIAVRLNANIDYFGGTVNIAAKLQSLAEQWQIVMSETSFSAPGVADHILRHGIQLEDVTYTSAVFPDGIRAKRWQVYPIIPL